MKHYLDLIPISAKLHKRQSRMTRFCIILAAALVTVIFGMADMEIRTQKIQALQTDGGWHAGFKSISQKQAALIAARPEITASSWYAASNYRLDKDYTIEGKKTVICGFDESMPQLIPAAAPEEGSFPRKPDEIIAAKSLMEQLGVQIGDKIELTAPGNERLTFTISGFTGNTSLLTDRDAFGIFLNTAAYRSLFSEAADYADFIFYVKFTPFCNIQQTIRTIQTQLQLEDSQVMQNVKILGLMLQSNDPTMLYLYATAAVLAALVAVSGIFMISGSLNSNISRRTEFFGMLRCLGASKKQVSRFVRREALSWCRTAIPLGIAAGTVVIWALCGVLKLLSPGLFSGMPTFSISFIGILSGTLIGIITVLCSASSPAKKAAGVSPLTAVSGNAGTTAPVRRAANTRLFKIDTVLGIHHATGSKKNLFLTAGSFAFCIILFLAFGTAIDFMNHAITPLKPYAPDLSIVSENNTCSLSPSLADELSQNPIVKRAYGRSFSYNMPFLSHETPGNATLISYEKHQLRWAEDLLLEGSMEAVTAGEGVLSVYHTEGALPLGSVLAFDTASGPRQVTVTGVLSSCPFQRSPGSENIICSEALFKELTGERGYTIIDMQLTAKADDSDVNEIRKAAGSDTLFSDRRMSNREVKGAYYSLSLFIYGFLVVIAFISVFNIINMTAMSVSARMKQYGAMRAIGMSSGQLLKMIAAETAACALCGIAAGCLAGIPLNRLLFHWLVTFRWGTPWYFPGRMLAVILTVITISVLLAIYGPAKRIRSLSAVDTISAD